MLIDSHCHLPHEKYEKSIEDILKEAKSFGVEKFITIGTSAKENKLAIETAEKYDDVFCSIGIHPHEDNEFSTQELLASLEEDLKKSQKIVGIGECGVDISNLESERSLKNQLEIFEMQLIFANDQKLPVIIHNRNGDSEVYLLLKKYSSRGIKGVMHCFNSNWGYAQKIIDIGFCISFTNMISYPKKEVLLEVVKKVPMDKFLVETDAPYLPLQRLRGEICYPKYVRMVAESVAQIKGKSFEEVCDSTYVNTCSLFNI